MSLVHAVSCLCRTEPAAALALLSQAAGLARWNLGLWHTQEVAPGLLAGRSLFGGAAGQVQVQVDAQRGTVGYAVGATPAARQLRIEARVQPAVELGYAPGLCLVSLLAWRPADMDDGRWQRLQAAHAVEIELIRSCLESADPA